MDGYKTIVLEGKEYYLVPKLSSGSVVAVQAEPEDIIADYLTEEPEVTESVDLVPSGVTIKSAEVKQSEHRKRFLEHRLEAEDINKGKGIPSSAIRQFGDTPDINQAQYKGEKLFFGEGLQTG